MEASYSCSITTNWRLLGKHLNVRLISAPKSEAVVGDVLQDDRLRLLVFHTSLLALEISAGSQRVQLAGQLQDAAIAIQ